MELSLPVFKCVFLSKVTRITSSILIRVYRHTRLMPSHQAKVRGNESSIIHIDDSHINQYCAVHIVARRLWDLFMFRPEMGRTAYLCVGGRAYSSIYSDW